MSEITSIVLVLLYSCGGGQILGDWGEIPILHRVSSLIETELSQLSPILIYITSASKTH